MRYLLIFSLLFAVCSADAHHSRANFLLKELITLEGTVTDFEWTSPHMWIKADITNEAGEVEQWTIEGNAIAPLIRFGWDRETVQTGDRVTFVGNPDRDPENKLLFLDHLVRTDGRAFYNLTLPDEEAQKLAAELAPTAPSTDFTGTWERVASTQFFLLGSFLPPSDWPLSEKGQELVDNFNLDEDPFYDCVPNSFPKMIYAPFGHKWTRTEDAIYVEKELSPVGRTIHLREDFPEDVEPDRYGYSIGYFDDNGDLIVETKHFTYDKWGLARGLDSSDQKEIHERWSLTNDGYGLHLVMTLTDPVYLSEPHVIEWDFEKTKDYELAQEECTLDSAKKHIEMQNAEAARVLDETAE